MLTGHEVSNAHLEILAADPADAVEVHLLHGDWATVLRPLGAVLALQPDRMPRVW